MLHSMRYILVCMFVKITNKNIYLCNKNKTTTALITGQDYFVY